ncbi:hypothetical protein [Corynebacterium sp. UMB2355A]|nr:hypothetical protein [Corynebacterium sp. UMB2355A]WPJ91786.1 hypothetical protein R0V12_05590 [Corynebacterium sp. UMB2355A]
MDHRSASGTCCTATTSKPSSIIIGVVFTVLAGIAGLAKQAGLIR